VVAVQDHLGEIQDADVATRLLADYLAKAYKEQASIGVVASADLDGVSRYLGHRREQARQMTASFPQLWKQIDSASSGGGWPRPWFPSNKNQRPSGQRLWVVSMGCQLSDWTRIRARGRWG
jgi:hypothetical protein